MRNFCLFLALLLLCYPMPKADLLDYFDSAEYEFCTAEEPPADLAAVGNGVWWEVRATQSDRRDVYRRLDDVKGVAVTVPAFDQERFFRDFRVIVDRVQNFDGLVLYEGTAAGRGIQIAVREDCVKIGIPALLGSY